MLVGIAFFQQLILHTNANFMCDFFKKNLEIFDIGV